MLSQFIRNIKFLFLRTKYITLLKEENAALTRALIESIDLVSDYKRAIQELQRAIGAIYNENMRRLAEEAGGENFLEELENFQNEKEEDEVKEYYEALMKKVTIH